MILMRYSVSGIEINSYRHLLELVSIRMQSVCDSYAIFIKFILAIRKHNSYQGHISNSYTQFVSKSYQIRIKFVSISCHNSYRNQTVRIQFLSLVRLYELSRITLFTHTFEFVSIRIKAIL